MTTNFLAPADTLHTNVIGTTNLLHAVRIMGLRRRIHVCSSFEAYGQVREDEIPIRETNPFGPASPYAVSKVGEDMVALQYFLSYGIDTVRTRMFTHTGPRRGLARAQCAGAPCRTWTPWRGRRGAVHRHPHDRELQGRIRLLRGGGWTLSPQHDPNGRRRRRRSAALVQEAA